MIESLADIFLGFMLGLATMITCMMLYFFVSTNMKMSIKKEIGYYDNKENEYYNKLKEIIKEALKENKEEFKK